MKIKLFLIVFPILLSLVGRSQTKMAPLFISFKKGSVTPEQELEIKTALYNASQKQPLAEPLDWFETLQPTKWRLKGKEVNFNWKLYGIKKRLANKC